MTHTTHENNAINQKNATQTHVTFLGTDAVLPTGGGDTASFVINGRCLVDTGWYSAIKMRSYGPDPLGLDYLFLTHCHHDHYLGLPGLLFSLAMRADECPDRAPLKIIGPAEDLARVVGLAQQFLQMDRFAPVRYEPELIPLRPGDHYQDPAFTLSVGASVHPVPGLCYRFTDTRTGKVVAFPGDTAYDPAIVAHVQGADLLIHEASYGASPAPQNNPSLHSGAPDAARVALEAGVGRLALLHAAESKREAALAAARLIFPATLWPADGETVWVG